MKPAIFLDRDGTLIEDRGYLRKKEEVCFYSFTLEALKQLQPDYLFFIVTNQACISEGIASREEVDLVNRHVEECLSREGIVISSTFVCPHSKKDACLCRKPSPHFIREALKIRPFDLERSFTIGDHPSDVLLGRNAGCTGLYVLTGHGEKHREEILPPTPVFKNLLEASQWILSRGKKEEKQKTY